MIILGLIRYFMYAAGGLILGWTAYQIALFIRSEYGD